MAYYLQNGVKIPYKSPSFAMASSSSFPKKGSNRMLEYGILFAVLALIAVFAYRAKRR